MSKQQLSTVSSVPHNSVNSNIQPREDSCFSHPATLTWRPRVTARGGPRRVPAARLGPVLNPAVGGGVAASAQHMPWSGKMEPTHLGTSDLHAVDAGDGVDEVVGLVDDHHLALQPDPRRLAGGRVQQHLIGEHHQLEGERGPEGAGPLPPPGGWPSHPAVPVCTGSTSCPEHVQGHRENARAAHCALSTKPCPESLCGPNGKPIKLEPTGPLADVGRGLGALLCPWKWGRSWDPGCRAPSVPPRQPRVLVLELCNSGKVNLSASVSLSVEWARYTLSHKTTTARTPVFTWAAGMANRPP